MWLWQRHHCVKIVRIWSFPGLHFPPFGLNTEIYSANLRILSKCGEIPISKYRHFSSSALTQKYTSFSTASISPFLNKPFLRKLRILLTIFYLKVKHNSYTLFYRAIKTITRASTGLSFIQPSNTCFQVKDSNAHFLIKEFCKEGCVLNFSWGCYICVVFFFIFFFTDMFINAIPDDCFDVCRF